MLRRILLVSLGMACAPSQKPPAVAARVSESYEAAPAPGNDELLVNEPDIHIPGYDPSAVDWEGGQMEAGLKQGTPPVCKLPRGEVTLEDAQHYAECKMRSEDRSVRPDNAVESTDYAKHRGLMRGAIDCWE